MSIYSRLIADPHDASARVDLAARMSHSAAFSSKPTASKQKKEEKFAFASMLMSHVYSAKAMRAQVEKNNI